MMRRSAGAVRVAAGWSRRHLKLWILIAGLFDAALVTLVSVLISLPGQRPGAINGLVVTLLILLLLSIVFPVVGNIAGERDKARKSELERDDQIDRLITEGSFHKLPKLSQLTNDVLGATPTRYSIEGNAPYALGRKPTRR